MIKALAISAIAASLLATTATAPIQLEVSPPPAGQITIDVVTVNGSGCPAGTAAVAPSPDNTAFTVTYSNYTAMVGVGATATDFRKNCQLVLRLNIPQGFTFAIAQADYRGYAFLEAGSSGSQRAHYYFQGSSATGTIVHPLTGPFDDNWQHTDTAAIASLVWAPCGEQRLLNVNTELRVAAGTSNTASTTSLVSMDSLDGSVATIYQLAWRTC